MNEFSMTTWVNPTPHVQKFEIHTSPGQPMTKIDVKPGGEVQIPSKYDQAIRTVREGVVVGGLAPMLVIKGQEKIPVHDAIVRAAAAGETERRLIASTGATAGGLGLDAAAQLLQRNQELEKQLEAQKTTFEQRLAEIEARLTPAPAPRGGTRSPASSPAAPAASPVTP